MNNRVEIEIVLGGEERVNRQVSQTRDSISQLGQGFNRASERLSDMERGLGSSTVAMASLGASALITYGSMKLFVNEGIRLNSTMENLYSITSSINALNMPTIIDGKIIGESEKLQKVLGLTSYSMDKIRDSSASALLPMEEFGRVSNYALGVALKSGTDMGENYTQIIDNTVNMSEKLTNALVKMGVESEDIGEQVRMILSGEFGNDEISAFLGFSEEGILDAKTRVNGLADYIDERLAKIEPYLQTGTWSESVSVLKRDYEKLVEISTQPLFRDLKREIQDFSGDVDSLGRSFQEVYHDLKFVGSSVNRAFNIETPSLDNITNGLLSAKNIANGLAIPVMIFNTSLENSAVFIEKVGIGIEALPLTIKKSFLEMEIGIDKAITEASNVIDKTTTSLGESFVKLNENFFGVKTPEAVKIQVVVKAETSEAENELDKINKELIKLKEKDSRTKYVDPFDEAVKIQVKNEDIYNLETDIQRLNSIDLDPKSLKEAEDRLNSVKNVALQLHKKYDKLELGIDIDDRISHTIQNLEGDIQKFKSTAESPITPNFKFETKKLQEYLGVLSSFGNEFAQFELQEIAIRTDFKPILDLQPKFKERVKEIDAEIKALSSKKPITATAEVKQKIEILEDEKEKLKALEVSQVEIDKRIDDLKKDFVIDNQIKPIFDFMSDMGLDEKAKEYEKEILGREFEKGRDLTLKYHISTIADFDKDSKLLQLIKSEKSVHEIALELKVDKTKVERVKNLYKTLEEGKEKYVTENMVKADVEIANLTDLQKTLASSFGSAFQQAVEGADFSSISLSFTNSISSMYANQFSQNLMNPSAGLFSGMAGGGLAFGGVMAGSYVLNNWDSISDGLFGGKVSTLDKGFELTENLSGYFDNEIDSIQKYEDKKKSGGIFGSSKTWTEFSDYSGEQVRQLRNFTAEMQNMYNYFSMGTFELEAGSYSGTLEDSGIDKFLSDVSKIEKYDYYKKTYDWDNDEDVRESITKDEFESFVENREKTSRYDYLTDDQGSYFESWKLSFDYETTDIFQAYKQSWQEFANNSSKELEEVIFEAKTNLESGSYNLDSLINEFKGVSNFKLDEDKASLKLSETAELYSSELEAGVGSFEKMFENGKRNISVVNPSFRDEIDDLFLGKSIDLTSWQSLKEKILETNEYTPQTVEAVTNLNTAILDLANAENRRLQAIKSQTHSLGELYDTVSETNYFKRIDYEEAMERLGVDSKNDYLETLKDAIGTNSIISEQNSADMQLLGEFFKPVSGELEALTNSLKDLDDSLSDYSKELSTGSYSPLKESDKTVELEANLDLDRKNFKDALALAEKDNYLDSEEIANLQNLESRYETSLNSYLGSAQKTMLDSDYLSAFNKNMENIRAFELQTAALIADSGVNPVVTATNEVRDEVALLREEIKNIKINLEIKSDVEAQYIASQNIGG
jgi:acyl carrier protein phosphodiesterase